MKVPFASKIPLSSKKLNGDKRAALQYLGFDMKTMKKNNEGYFYIEVPCKKNLDVEKNTQGFIDNYTVKYKNTEVISIHHRRRSELYAPHVDFKIDGVNLKRVNLNLNPENLTRKHKGQVRALTEFDKMWMADIDNDHSDLFCDIM